MQGNLNQFFYRNSHKNLILIFCFSNSELSSETKSNPTFKIIEQPRYGSLSLLSFGQSSSHDIVHEFTQDDIIKNRIVYEAFANVEIIYPMNEIITDRIRYELRALNVQTAQGVLVINIFNNHSDSNDLMNQFLMKNNYLSYLGMTTMFKEQFFLLLFFFILFLVLLIPVLMIIIRSLCFASAKSKSKSTKCSNSNNNDYVTQTLSPTTTTTTVPQPPPPTTTTTQTDHSSTITHSSSSYCSRPNLDSSTSHYSSNATFNNDHSIIRNDHNDVIGSKSSPFNHDFDQTINLQLLKRDGHKKYGHDEIMSPLPPPSLYFINDYHNYDSPTRNNRCWNNNKQINDTDEDVLDDGGESQSDDTIDIANIHNDNFFPSKNQKSLQHLTCSYSPPFPFGSNENDDYQNDRIITTTTTMTNRNEFDSNLNNKNQYWI